MKKSKIYNMPKYKDSEYDWKKYYELIRAGSRIRNHHEGCGFYLSSHDVWNEDNYPTRELEMESGYIGLYKLAEASFYSDPKDMVKESWWYFIGYKDRKLIKDCETFEEFEELYMKE